jgi:uncharacterized protein
MELRVLKSVIEEVLGSELIEKRITLVWHAGEPLTLPIAYYAAAFEFLNWYANLILKGLSDTALR